MVKSWSLTALLAVYRLNQRDTRIGGKRSVVANALEQGEVVERLLHPNSQILYIGDGVENATNGQQIRISAKKLTSTKKNETKTRVQSKKLDGFWYIMYVTMRRLCFLRLKCGSGNRKNIFLICNEIVFFFFC